LLVNVWIDLDDTSLCVVAAAINAGMPDRNATYARDALRRYRVPDVCTAS